MALARRTESDHTVRGTHRVSLPGIVRDLPRWIFLGALLYAPWYYGGTTAGSIIGLNWLLTAVAVLWVAELLIRRRLPIVPLGLVTPIAAVLLLGWAAAWNAHAIHDSELELFAPVIRKIGRFAPSSVDRMVATTAMIRVSCLLGALLFAADLASRPHWLLRIWITIGLAGGSIALLGLLQRATGAVLPYWQDQPGEHSTFFATYYYHANAGAFLNLVFAPTAGLALRAFQRPSTAVQRAAWSCSALLLLAAIFANTSRGAQFFGLLVLVGFVLGPGRQLRRLGTAQNRVVTVVTTVVIAAALIAVAQASGITQGLDRWQRISEQLPADMRWQAYKAAVAALPHAGWTGFGPGTFSAIFPPYACVFRIESAGRWEFLHQDYLQTFLEWGVFGALAWAVLLFGGMAAGVIGWRRAKAAQPQPRIVRLLPLLLLALGATAGHALVDFPLQVASLQLYVATYLGICWASARPLAKIDHSARRCRYK